jgi:hypothetical protein
VFLSSPGAELNIVLCSRFSDWYWSWISLELLRMKSNGAASVKFEAKPCCIPSSCSLEEVTSTGTPPWGRESGECSWRV